jgi:hypothetical protein
VFRTFRARKSRIKRLLCRSLCDVSTVLIKFELTYHRCNAEVTVSDGPVEWDGSALHVCSGIKPGEVLHLGCGF